MKLKFAPFCSSRDAPSDGILFCRSQNFPFLTKTMDYNHGLIFGSPKKVVRKVYHPKGNEKRNLTVLVSAA